LGAVSNGAHRFDCSVDQDDLRTSRRSALQMLVIMNACCSGVRLVQAIRHLGRDRLIDKREEGSEREEGSDCQFTDSRLGCNLQGLRSRAFQGIEHGYS
jgi:hypothetical protein